MISATADHPFYVENRRFVNAGELKVGDETVNSNGDVYLIECIYMEVVEKPVTVYNFQAEDFHTYYVGSTGILVHNASEKYSSAKDFEKALSEASNKGERRALSRQEGAEVAKGKGLIKDLKLSNKNGYDVYKDPKTGKLYSVDELHGRFETTTARGIHQGEVDFDFNPTKSVDKSGGHNLKVK